MWRPFKSMQLCVKTCPDKDLRTPQDVKDFALRTGSRLCLYNIPVDEYTTIKPDMFSKNGPCPSLPIYKRYVCPDLCMSLCCMLECCKSFINFEHVFHYTCLRENGYILKLNNRLALLLLKLFFPVH